MSKYCAFCHTSGSHAPRCPELPCCPECGCVLGKQGTGHWDSCDTGKLNDPDQEEV